MSEITAEIAREVLALAIAHRPGELEDALRLHDEALDSVGGLSRGQAFGPDPVPASVGVAFGRFDEALWDLSLDIKDYATAMDPRAAMA